MKFRKIFLTLIIASFVYILPNFASAEIVLPCSRGTAQMCGFNDVFTLINNLIKFFLSYVLLPLSIILVSYAGWLFMTSGGNESKRTQAKAIFKNLLIGIAIFLLAWSIVYFVFKAFGVKGSNGLSDKTVDWKVDGSSLPQINTGTQSSGQNNNSSNNSSNQVLTSYAATITYNAVVPSSTRATVTITPKAPYEMAIRMKCIDRLSGDTATGEAKIASGSSVTTIVIDLQEETEYSCALENIEGQIKMNDITDSEIMTPRVSPVTGDFTFSGGSFDSDENTINIRYRNADKLYSSSGFLSCFDSTNSRNLFNMSGILLNREKGSDLRYATYNLPSNFSSTLEDNINVSCSFYTYTLVNKIITETENKFTGTIKSTKKIQSIKTRFLVTEKQIGQDSVTIIFNGSININPNLSLACYSNNSNHVFRTRATFDPTTNSRLSQAMNPSFNKDSIYAPITIPVAWFGYGLRPGSVYSCNLEGETLEKVSGYEDQVVTKHNHSFSLSTPLIPAPIKLESKLDYYVSIGVPRIVYVNYPYVKPVNVLSGGPYLSESQFRQPIPDSIFVPVTNGLVVDNSRMNMVCTSIVGPAAGTTYSTLVSVSETQSADTFGIAQVYGANNNLGSGFSIPIVRTPRGGFMHSSVYACMLGFTVGSVPQIRSFMASVPISIDPTEIGPINLSVENINADKSYANFTIVASPRIENSVKYTCRHPSGNYTGEAYWPPQALGIRMPVAIPVMSSLPGLKPATNYSCTLEGSTYQKQIVEYQFNIQTP